MALKYFTPNAGPRAGHQLQLPLHIGTSARQAVLDAGGTGIQSLGLGDGSIVTTGNRRLFIGVSTYPATFWITHNWLRQMGYGSGNGTSGDMYTAIMDLQAHVTLGGPGKLEFIFPTGVINYVPNLVYNSSGVTVTSAYATAQIQGEIDVDTDTYHEAMAVVTVPFKILKGQWTLVDGSNTLFPVF